MMELKDPKGLLNLTFVCPERGGSMFGSSYENGKVDKGYCHDFKDNGERCRFTWDRPWQDSLVFVPKK